MNQVERDLQWSAKPRDLLHGFQGGIRYTRLDVSKDLDQTSLLKVVESHSMRNR